MSFNHSARFLESFDLHRGVIEGSERVLREYSPDRSECRIIRVKATSEEIPDVIAMEKSRADQFKYTLEWKVYEHDVPANLTKNLLLEGFEPEDEEAVLVFPLTTPIDLKKTLTEIEIVKIQDQQSLWEVAEISHEIGRKDVDTEMKRLGDIMREAPSSMSVYVLRKKGEPISCGRVHYQPGSSFAELAGHRTKTKHRRLGYFSFLVCHQLMDIAKLSYPYVFVDALPTSELALRRLGFISLTKTRPFIYRSLKAIS